MEFSERQPPCGDGENNSNDLLSTPRAGKHRSIAINELPQVVEPWNDNLIHTLSSNAIVEVEVSSVLMIRVKATILVAICKKQHNLR